MMQIVARGVPFSASGTAACVGAGLTVTLLRSAGAAAATPAIMEPANSKPPARADMFIADLFIAVSPKPSMDQNVDLL